MKSFYTDWVGWARAASRVKCVVP